MSELAEKLIEQALGLPANERAAFAERLLSSLDPELSEIDQLWAIQFGQGAAANGPANQLFFTAGPNNYANGLFGTITLGK